MSIQSVNPRTGEVFGPAFPSSTDEETAAMITSSLSAYGKWSAFTAHQRARMLDSLADALDANLESLVEIADLETGLGAVRLSSEVGRTTFQIRTFARALAAGQYVTPIPDNAVEEPLPVGHPKFLRMHRGIGPVVIFGASNFPFAFSVMGGDSAAALAAGCSIVIKAHPAHPQTSQWTFDIAAKALRDAGAPTGLVALGHGFEFGAQALKDPRIRASAFTGSRTGGRALFDMAQSRANPIPFYGELGSVNPVVVMESALQDSAKFAGSYLDSLLMGNGQFCTNPSLLFVPQGESFLDEVRAQLAHRDLQPFLSQATKALHDANRGLIIRTTRAEVLEGKKAGDVGFYSSPQVLVLSASEIKSHVSDLHIECFGPTGIAITYANLDEVRDILVELEGALVGSLFSSPTDHAAAGLLHSLSSLCGRVAFNAWPTGVAVTAGQHHGGPYPASTSPLHTSVGVSAMIRFLRPVTFQGVPEDLATKIN